LEKIKILTQTSPNKECLSVKGGEKLTTFQSLQIPTGLSKRSGDHYSSVLKRHFKFQKMTPLKIRIHNKKLKLSFKQITCGSLDILRPDLGDPDRDALKHVEAFFRRLLVIGHDHLFGDRGFRGLGGCGSHGHWNLNLIGRFFKALLDKIIFC
jgi:hypothetical protein